MSRQGTNWFVVANAVSVQELSAYEAINVPTGGWNVYDTVNEFKRQGIGSDTRAWRISRVNASYDLCQSYPATLVVPAHVSDATVTYAGRFRSKGRVPSLTYFHRANHASISRASQPMTGLKQARSVQDQKLVEAMFETHANPDAGRVFGATKANIIFDARSFTNAMANMAKGAGTENMENYPMCTKIHLGIDNIHAMRESLARVTAELRKADLGPTGTHIDQLALRQSGWLKHLSATLAGAAQVVKTVHIHSSHALVHCSDGWDRTAQITSLAQICLDPFFRTCRGFAVLVEKDWMSFGHRFCERSGLIGFAMERFDLSPPAIPEPRTATETFDELQDDRSLGSFWDFTKQLTISLNGGAAAQRSPIFFQFLDAVAQLVRQFPERFEYSGKFLAHVFYHVHNGHSGSFLHNSERERTASPRPAPTATPSVWDSVLNVSELCNERYNPALDAGDRDLGVLMPDAKNVLFSPDLLRRPDSEINSLLLSDAARQRRFGERLRNASSAPKSDGTGQEDSLQSASTKMRSIFSTGWGRVQDAWRGFDTVTEPKTSSPDQSPASCSPGLHNPWVNAPRARETESLSQFSLEPPRGAQQPEAEPSSPPTTFDPLGVREI